MSQPHEPNPDATGGTEHEPRPPQAGAQPPTESEPTPSAAPPPDAPTEQFGASDQAVMANEQANEQANAQQAPNGPLMPPPPPGAQTGRYVFVPEGMSLRRDRRFGPAFGRFVRNRATHLVAAVVVGALVGGGTVAIFDTAVNHPGPQFSRVQPGSGFGGESRGFGGFGFGQGGQGSGN